MKEKDDEADLISARRNSAEGTKWLIHFWGINYYTICIQNVGAMMEKKKDVKR